jgi:hypothetical protein
MSWVMRKICSRHDMADGEAVGDGGNYEVQVMQCRM